MKKLLAPLVVLGIATSTSAAFVVAFHSGVASAQTPVVDVGVVDAAPAPDAGSAVPEPTPAAAAVTTESECVYKGQPIACDKLGEKFNENPIDAASTVRELWKGGGAIPAIIVALFAALVIASKRIPWLTGGKRAAYTASGLGFLTILAEPASRGTTPTLSMFIGAIGAALLLFMNSGTGTTTSTTSSSS